MNVDNLREIAIITVGQAALSGPGLDGAVSRHHDPSGVLFAFTNRLVALSERIRKSVVQLSRNVTNLPNTRRNHAVATTNEWFPSDRETRSHGGAFLFYRARNSESIRPASRGVITVNNLEENNHTLSSEGEHE